MKYWECINIPGKTNVEGAKTSAPSTDGNTLDVGNVTPSIVETVNDIPTDKVVDSVNEVSSAYAKMVVDALNCGTTKVEPVVDTTDDNSVPLTTTTKTPEEINALKYVSVDEVDISLFDADGEFEIPEVDKAPDDMIVELSYPTEDTVMITETRVPAIDEELTPENDENVSEKSFDKNALLESIFSNGGEELAASIAEKVVEKVVETPEPPEPVYTLEPSQLEKVIESLIKYEEEYFKEIPITHLSNRFLRNITKDVYRAHQDAVEKYEDPALMDPLFLLYPLTCDDPYMAMGKFWNIVTTKIMNDPEWKKAVEDSVIAYDKYMAESEEDEDEDETESIE